MTEAKRIYWETLKKYALKVGIPTSVGLFLLFIYLNSQGFIIINSYSGDMRCAGVPSEPCYATITFTPIYDIFLYPVSYDPWGRNSPFIFDTPLESWKFERSWGNGWRTIPLNESCKGTWCGAPSSNSNVTYSIVFRAGKTYTVRLTGYKYNLTQDVKWSFGTVNKSAVLDPLWSGYKADDFFTELLENDADIDGGYAIFKVKNPTSFEINVNQKTLNVTIEKVVGTSTKDIKYYYAENVTYVNNITEYSTNYSECNPFNETYMDNEYIIDNCTVYASSWHFNNRTIEEWKLFSSLLFKQNEEYKIKIVAKWSPKIGLNIREWIPQISIEDSNIKQFKWAFWNTSWTYCKNITFTENSGSTQVNFPVNIKVNTSGNGQAFGEDIRIVNASCNNGGSSIEFGLKKIGADDFNATFKILSLAGTTVYSMYYGNETVEPAANISWNKAGNNWFAGSEDGTVGVNDANWLLNAGSGTWKIDDITTYNGTQSMFFSQSASTLYLRANQSSADPTPTINNYTMVETSIYFNKTGDQALYYSIGNNTKRCAIVLIAGVSKTFTYYSSTTPTSSGISATLNTWYIYQTMIDPNSNKYNVSVLFGENRSVVFAVNGATCFDPFVSGTNTVWADGTVNGVNIIFDNVLLRGWLHDNTYPTDILGNEESEGGPAAKNVNIYFNGTLNANRTYVYPSDINITGTGEAGETVNIYRDGVLAASGSVTASDLSSYLNFSNATYAYKVNSTNNATGLTYYVLVNKGTITVSLYLNGTQDANKTYTYPEAVNATGSVSLGTLNLFRDGVDVGTIEQILLGNGTYAYKANATGTANYSDNSTGVTFYALINKGASAAVLYLNGSTSSQSSTYPNASMNATATSSISGLYVQLWRNGTLTSNQSNTAWNISTQGPWNNNWTAKVQGNANYSDSAQIDLWWNISKGASPVFVYMNGSASGQTYILYTIANITATSTLSQVINLTSNTTGWIEATNTSVIYNTTNMSDSVGPYYFNVSTLGNENYSANYSTQIATIVLGIPPQWSSNTSSTPTTYSPTTASSFYISWDGGSADMNVSIEGNWSGATNYTMTSSSGSVIEDEGFEGSFPPTGWNTGCYGTGCNNWHQNSTNPLNDSYSAGSGDIGDGNHTWINKTVTFASAGWVSFFWGVSSEYNYDFVCYCLDKACGATGCTCSGSSGTADARLSSASGSSGVWRYQFVNKSVTAGTHNFTWCYKKDTSITYGDDMGKIDNISFNTSAGGSGNNYSYTSNLPAGTYYWKSYANNSSASFNTSDTWYFTIGKGGTLTTLLLNGSASNQSSAYPNSTVNVSATSNVSGLYVQVWRNTSLLNNRTTSTWNISQVGAGLFWNYTAKVLGNANYSASAQTTLYWNVSQGTPTLHLALNGTEGNKTYTYPEAVNVTGSVDECSDLCGELFKNGTTLTNTDILNFTFVSNFSTASGLSPAGIYYNGTFLYIIERNSSTPFISKLMRYLPDGTYDNMNETIMNNCRDISSNGTHIYIVNTTTLGIYDFEGNLMSSINTGLYDIKGIWTNTTHSFISEWSYDRIRAYFNNGTYADWYFDIIDAGIFGSGGIFYDGTSNKFYTVAGNSSSNGVFMSYKNNTAGINGSWYIYDYTKEYPASTFPDGGSDGLTFNGTHMWTAGLYTGRYYIYTYTNTTQPIINITNISTIYAVGLYNFSFEYYENANYTAEGLWYYATVNKGTITGSLYLNGSTSQQTSTYPNSTINATGASSVAGTYAQLWRNGTLISNHTTTAWNITNYYPSNYNFSLVVLGNENYTSSTQKNLWWNISTGVPQATAYINGSTTTPTTIIGVPTGEPPTTRYNDTNRTKYSLLGNPATRPGLKYINATPTFITNITFLGNDTTPTVYINDVGFSVSCYGIAPNLECVVNREIEQNDNLTIDWFEWAEPSCNEVVSINNTWIPIYILLWNGEKVQPIVEVKTGYKFININMTGVSSVSGLTVNLSLNATGYGDNWVTGTTSASNISNASIIGEGIYNFSVQVTGNANYSDSALSTIILNIKNISINVERPSGTDLWLINISNCTPITNCYQTGNYTPQNQSDAQWFYRINNTGNETIDITIAKNTTLPACMNWYITNVSTEVFNEAGTHVNQSDDGNATYVYFDLGIGQSATFWTWVEFNSCTPGTTTHFQDTFTAVY